jgi:cysteine desulfuration protein SufE
MAQIPERLERLLQGLDLLADRGERIEYLIAAADRFREVPPEVARRPFPRERLVPGCESEAYAWAEPLPDGPDGALKFHFAVENPQGISARAMAVILDETLSGAPAEEVLAVPGDLPYRVFAGELSVAKNLGLTGILALVQAAARRQLAARPAAGGEGSGDA